MSTGGRGGTGVFWISVTCIFGSAIPPPPKACVGDIRILKIVEGVSPIP